MFGLMKQLLLATEAKLLTEQAQSELVANFTHSVNKLITDAAELGKYYIYIHDELDDFYTEPLRDAGYTVERQGERLYKVSW